MGRRNEQQATRQGLYNRPASPFGALSGQTPSQGAFRGLPDSGVDLQNWGARHTQALPRIPDVPEPEGIVSFDRFDPFRRRGGIY